ncbi:MAG: RAMP superfamily CRISPR-associated protein [Bacillota bacterium]
MAEDKHRTTLYVELRALEPLHLGGRHLYGSYRAGETVLHGGRVLAALAEAAGEFPLFGGGNNIIIEDAPIAIGPASVNYQVVYLPLTAETCKTFSGSWFLEPDKNSGKEERHGFWDTLIWRWLVHNRRWTDFAIPLWGCCMKCGEAAKPASGFVERWLRRADERLEYRYQAGETFAERRTHTAINPARGVAEFGMLFTEDLLLEDTVRYVRVRLQGTENEVKKRLEDLEKLFEHSFSVGGAKSRGHGKMNAELRRDAKPEAEPLGERIERFDELVKKMAGNLLEEEEKKRIYFVITTQSAVVLPDQDVCPDWHIREGDQGGWQSIFPRLTSLRDSRLEFFQHRFTQVTGWSTLWNLPKPALRAIAPGSVYLFSTAAEPADLEAVAAELEFSGGGLFRAEGYGALNVSDPFHREVRL